MPGIEPLLIREQFLTALNLQPPDFLGGGDVSGFIMPFEVKSKRPNLGFLMAPPKISKVHGEIPSYRSDAKNYDVTLSHHGVALPINMTDLRQNLWKEQYALQISQLAEDIKTYGWRYFRSERLGEIVAGITAYDGVNFFSASHPIAATGATQSNSITYNVADNTGFVPTQEEARDIVEALLGQVGSMKSDTGESISDIAEGEYLLVCHITAYLPFFHLFFNTLNVNIRGGAGESNDMRALAPKFKIVTSDDSDMVGKVVLVKKSVPGFLSAFVEPVYLQMATEFGPYNPKTESVDYVVQTWREIWPGEYRLSCLSTLS